jgi:hypothetical protein
MRTTTLQWLHKNPRHRLIMWIGIISLSLVPLVWWYFGWLDTYYVPEFRMDNTMEMIQDSWSSFRNLRPSSSLASIDFFEAEEHDEDTHTESKAMLHVIMQYPYILDKWKDGRVLTPGGGKRRVLKREVDRRQDEYHTAIRYTLSHPSIFRLHLLYNRTRDWKRLKHVLFLNTWQEQKLHPVFWGRMMTYGDAFGYANNNLPGKYVMIMNSDVYPTIQSIKTQDSVGGWASLSPAHFGRNNKTVFMLSRYSPACVGDHSVNLNPRKPRPCRTLAQMGSADAFIFRSPVPETVVKEMKNFPTNFWGAENRAAAALKRAGYGPFLNPCEVLPIQHNHCSRVRITGINAPRINLGNGNSHVSHFVKKLPKI